MQIVCTKDADGSLLAFASHDDGQDVSGAYPGMVVVAAPDGTEFVFGEAVVPDLHAYAAAARYAKETGGITVNGAPIATDRASQALITGAWATTQINPAATIQWKGPNGAFVTLDAKALIGLASAVTAHVQACFAAEAQVTGDIASGKVKTTADVDAAFSAVTA